MPTHSSTHTCTQIPHAANEGINRREENDICLHLNYLSMRKEEERAVHKLLIWNVTALQFLGHGLQFAMGWIFVKGQNFSVMPGLMCLTSYGMAPVLLDLPAGCSWCNSGLTFHRNTPKSPVGRTCFSSDTEAWCCTGIEAVHMKNTWASNSSWNWECEGI